MALPIEVINKLNEKFDPSLIKKRKLFADSNKEFSYVPAHTVVERLNNVFGHNIDSRILYFTPESVAIETGSIIAVVELTVRSGETAIVKQGFGSAKLTKTKSGVIVDLGNDYKAASSDAIKKAASQLGIGLHLYEGEGDVAEVVEEVASVPVSAGTTTPSPLPTTSKFSKKVTPAPKATNTNAPTNGAPASEKSLNLMFKLLGEQSKTVADFDMQEGEMTQASVSKVINQLLENSTAKVR